MKHKIEQHRGSDLLKLSLDAGESFTARAESVSSYGGAIQLDTTTTRSIWKAVGTYENFPVTSIESGENRGGIVTVSPSLSGEILCVEPRGDSLMVQSLGFVGCHPQYELDLKTSMLYDNDSIGLLVAENTDDSNRPVFLVGHEGVSKIELGEEQRTTVRQDHILAMDSSIEFEKVSSAGLKERALGTGYEPYMRLTGPGVVYTHVRSPISLNKTVEKLSDS